MANIKVSFDLDSDALSSDYVDSTHETGLSTEGYERLNDLFSAMGGDNIEFVRERDSSPPSGIAVDDIEDDSWTPFPPVPRMNKRGSEDE